MKKKAYIAIIAVLVVIFCASAVYLIHYFTQSKKSADRYNELAALVNSEREATTEAADAADSTEATAATGSYEVNTDDIPQEFLILPWYQEVYAQNNDLVGWLKIEGTVIDYPVVQTAEDNADYYLRRNFDKESATGGCLYVREQCDVFEPSDNLTIYGHNMHDGSMFASLLDYEEKSAWEENSLIQFDTIYEYHTYQIFAVFKTTASVDEGFKYHWFVDAADESEFDEFVSTCKELSFYDTGITPTYGDKIICLSTCEYTLENGRLVVAAVRIA